MVAMHGRISYMTATVAKYAVAVGVVCCGCC